MSRLLTQALPPSDDHHPGYPKEPKKPHRRCAACGRFLRWDDYIGRYIGHEIYDRYTGGYEWGC